MPARSKFLMFLYVDGCVPQIASHFFSFLFSSFFKKKERKKERKKKTFKIMGMRAAFAAALGALIISAVAAQVTEIVIAPESLGLDDAFLLVQ